MLQKLQLTNFRNYDDRVFEFDPVTVFVGPNGVGKTNILEAISFLALARSFRTRQDREVIRWDEEVARLVGVTDTTTIEVALSNQGKSGKLVKINGINRRAIELLGHLSVVLFLPESLSLIAGPPHLRRQFIDLLLVQMDRRYAYHLLQLQKVLRQRNQLLRQIEEGEAAADQLDFWNQSLVEHGSWLVAQRVIALQKINETITHHYKVMSQRDGELCVQYRAASVSESGGQQADYTDPSKAPTDPVVWAKLLTDSLEKYQSREIAAGASLYGPQRDDFTIILNNRPLSTFGSRGEFRSAILALKASEADYLLSHQNQNDDAPSLLFLLDDVYSELDEQRRDQLATLIDGHQAVITTTDLSHLDQAIQKKAKIINFH